MRGGGRDVQPCMLLVDPCRRFASLRRVEGMRVTRVAGLEAFASSPDPLEVARKLRPTVVVVDQAVDLGPEGGLLIISRFLALAWRPNVMAVTTFSSQPDQLFINTAVVPVFPLVTDEHRLEVLATIHRAHAAWVEDASEDSEVPVAC